MKITAEGTGVKSWRRDGSGGYGQIRCMRERCHVNHKFAVQNYPPDLHLGFRATEAEKAKHAADREAARVEFNAHELPTGWVMVRLAGEDHPTPRVFCSANCAALWLKKVTR